MSSVSKGERDDGLVDKCHIGANLVFPGGVCLGGGGHLAGWT